ncbi:MAG: hypothetical protein V3T02_05800, partial [Alphaproteobacteria bacterium]
MRKGTITASKGSRRWRHGRGCIVLAAGVMFAVLGLAPPVHGDSHVGGEQTDAAKTADDVSADGEDGAGAKGSPPGDAEQPKLDMASLEKKLRATPAIGFFTKLELKGQVDDLIEHFRAYHDQDGSLTLGGLRQRVNLLLLKVLTLLQDSDPGL